MLADGTSVPAEDLKRARHRESQQAETSFLRPCCATTSTSSRSFAAVGRRELLRSSLRCPNTIYLQKNHNGGGVADETPRDARTAHVTVYHDAEHPSALSLLS